MAYMLLPSRRQRFGSTCIFCLDLDISNPRLSKALQKGLRISWVKRIQLPRPCNLQKNHIIYSKPGFFVLKLAYSSQVDMELWVITFTFCLNRFFVLKTTLGYFSTPHCLCIQWNSCPICTQWHRTVHIFPYLDNSGRYDDSHVLSAPHLRIQMAQQWH